MDTIGELERLFDDAVPLLFQREALQLIVRCYAEAETARSTYGLCKPMGDWHQPLLRRAIIESQLSELAARYRPKLEPEFKYTKNRSAPYLLIQAGQFAITVSKVDEPVSLLRDADFRFDHSLVNYPLFAGLEGEPTEGPAYVILGIAPQFGESRPMSVRWLFPAGDYSQVRHNIDLLNRFGDQGGLGAQVPGSPPPSVDPKPRLRNPAERKRETQS